MEVLYKLLRGVEITKLSFRSVEDQMLSEDLIKGKGKVR